MSTGTVKQHVNEVIQAENLEIGGTALTATAAEINQAADKSAGTQTLTASGAVTAGKNCVYLNHATVAIAATAVATAHSGLFIVESTTEPGAGQDHTLTLTGGTFNGTNTVATFADAADRLVVFFDAVGRGHVILNTGSVALSGP